MQHYTLSGGELKLLIIAAQSLGLDANSSTQNYAERQSQQGRPKLLSIVAQSLAPESSHPTLTHISSTRC